MGFDATQADCDEFHDAEATMFGRRAAPGAASNTGEQHPWTALTLTRRPASTWAARTSSWTASTWTRQGPAPAGMRQAGRSAGYIFGALP